MQQLNQTQTAKSVINYAFDSSRDTQRLTITKDGKTSRYLLNLQFIDYSPSYATGLNSYVLVQLINLDQGYIINITSEAAKALGYKINQKRKALIMGGCGLNKKELLYKKLEQALPAALIDLYS